MHLRRALLLFAIVLGLAALAAALSRPADRGGAEPEPTTAPPASTATPRAPAAVSFQASRPRRRGLDAGRAAEVLVVVDSPGQVEIPGLGLSAPADPLTPARFDVLEDEPGRYPILFSPASVPASTVAETVGTLVVRTPEL
ncbi:MAG TPA: hypothetical protein VFQ12_09940 [Thermoleophilaceae bacterium]|nr:hypothetical protein [Thermoleophilaceae bacterium]